MLRIWVIWVIASTIVGLVIGLRSRARIAVASGAIVGLGAFGFNYLEGDGFMSSFWSLAAAGGGLAVGGLLGGAVMRLLGRS